MLGLRRAPSRARRNCMLDVSPELAKDKLPQPERIRGGGGRHGAEHRAQSGRNDLALQAQAQRQLQLRPRPRRVDPSDGVSAAIWVSRRISSTSWASPGCSRMWARPACPWACCSRPNALTPAERAVLRRHVEFSTQILARPDPIYRRRCWRSSPGITSATMAAATRSASPVRTSACSSEMAGLVDTYCAVCYDRPYRRGLDNQQALRKLYASRGRRFTEALIIEFIQCIGLYPVGTLVELRSGEVAVVVEQNRIRRLKPRVLVLLDERQARSRLAPFVLDLKDEPLAQDGTVYQIRMRLAPGAYGIEPREFYL
ncbi:MAG: hypothetical protein MZV65_39915 [Chromatiales bacterium]|nr:hypothetical protein [Chromatiales bacterium]